jgi:hypothetical protein
MPRSRLVLFVEADSDARAVAVLVRKLLTRLNAWDCVQLDAAPFVVRNITNLTGNTGNNASNWPRWLEAAQRRRDFGGVLLVLDGDARMVEGQEFCAKIAAQLLGRRAREVGAGSRFSVACVFACREFESWLLAGIESLKGRPLPDGRYAIAQDAVPPPDTETNPRDAKKALGQWMKGYRPSTDQALLAEMLDLDHVCDRGPRSFIRFVHAVEQLVEAFRSGEHIA